MCVHVYTEHLYKYADELLGGGQSGVRCTGDPVSMTLYLQIVDMLLGYALRLEYGDNADKFKAVTPEVAKEAAVAKPILNTGNPLDNLDPTSDEFRYLNLCRCRRCFGMGCPLGVGITAPSFPEVNVLSISFHSSCLQKRIADCRSDIRYSFARRPVGFGFGDRENHQGKTFQRRSFAQRG